MKSEDLVKSKVVFENEGHRYYLDGKRLSGITTMIKQMVFPDMYRGVSASTLKNAAARGTAIHEEVEMLVNGFPMAEENTSDEVRALKEWTAKNSVEFISSEYIVDLYPKPFQWDEEDEETHQKFQYAGYASAIDIIDSNGYLYDIKTTAKYEREYVSWQLSVYAYLFERQNPKLKVRGLRCVWLRDGKCIVYEVERKPDTLVFDLLCSYADGLPWSNPLESVDANIEDLIVKENSKDLARLADLEEAIIGYKNKAKAYEDEYEKLKAGLLDIMLENNRTTIHTDRLVLTAKAATTRTSIDSVALKKDMPSVYSKYVKQSPVKASLTIKVKE